MQTWLPLLVRRLSRSPLRCGQPAGALRRPRWRPAVEWLEPRTLLSFGALDPSFGSGGKVLSVFTGSERLSAAVLQPDGKIVAVGSNGAIVLVCYTPNGSLDPTFGRGGEVVTTVGHAANGVALQPDGKLVVVGSTTVSPGPTRPDVDAVLVARFNPDGSLDATFGKGGVVVTQLAPMGGSSAAEAVALQPGGTIVVGGTMGVPYADFFAIDTGFLLAVNPDGSTLGGANPAGPVNALAIQPDGRILAATQPGSIPYSPAKTPDLVRYTPNYQPDPTFGHNGTATNGGGNGLALQPDGRILVAGIHPAGGFTVARYNVNGNPDTTFGTAGRVSTAFSPGGDARAVAVLRDGIIVAAGTNFADFALAAYNPNGTPDTAFGSGGTVMTSFFSGADASALLVQPDGKLVAAGTAALAPTGVAFALARSCPRTSAPTPPSAGWPRSTSTCSSARSIPAARPPGRPPWPRGRLARRWWRQSTPARSSTRWSSRGYTAST
jgi:uncharacterized delta-60 repeat protein